MRIFFLSQVFRKIDIWNFKVQKAIQEQQQLIVESRSQVASVFDDSVNTAIVDQQPEY